MDTQEIAELLDSLDNRVIRELVEYPVSRVIQELKERVVTQVFRVILDRKEYPVTQGLKVSLVIRAMKEHPDFLVSPDIVESLAHLASAELVVTLASRDNQVIQESLDIAVSRALLVLVDHQVFLDIRVLMDYQDTQVHLDFRVPQVIRGLLERLGTQDRME